MMPMHVNSNLSTQIQSRFIVKNSNLTIIPEPRKLSDCILQQVIVDSFSSYDFVIVIQKLWLYIIKNLNVSLSFILVKNENI